ncbi:MAG TPA: di-heme oxidoredictase family protein [Bryobacteraceae bacterium]|nr:di-heme oxidoredictase family protein [Bryobacteraceae bacterium]
MARRKRFPHGALQRKHRTETLRAASTKSLRKDGRHKIWTLISSLVLVFASQAAQAQEATPGFDGKSNGLVDDQTHQADQAKFDEVEGVADGLGPLYNAQSCRECHQNPQSGGASQVSELRVGHLGPGHRFENPNIPIARGTETIVGRTLVNDRAICPNAAFPDTEIQERVPESESIRTMRLSVNLLGDGFVEALADQTLNALARQQCKQSHHKVCGLPIYVPIVESPGRAGVGRFGWKDAHASLLSFSGDAYLNEMGITNRLFPDEVTKLCNTASEPNDTPGPDGLSDVDHFARFIRASKAPARDARLAATPKAQKGSMLFDKIGCAVCHVRTLTTAPAGTKINGGAFTVPPALGSKTFHPYADFLLHDVGTGDGIAIPVAEHYGRVAHNMPKECPPENFQKTTNRVRTAPLWGVRLRPRLMHDGASTTFFDAVVRHGGEATQAAKNFRHLGRDDEESLIEFLRSL